MVILQIEPPNLGGQGDHHYRTAQPARALGMIEGVTVVSGSLLSAEIYILARRADVLVLCTVADADLLPVLRHRAEHGRLTVFEINDDVLNVQPWNPVASFYRLPSNRAIFLQLAASSHCLQASTPELARRYGHLQHTCAVFVNHLWDVPPLPSPQSSLSIGWGGSIGHGQDLAWVVPALKDVMAAYPWLTFSLMGPPELAALFTWLEPGRFRYTPSGGLDEYRDFLRDAQIGIAPLRPTDFNRCRSDVKFLEYAAAGTVTLCSDMEPYAGTVRNGVNGLLWRDLDELATCLRQSIEDAALRARLRANAHRYVRDNRLERQHAQERLDYYTTRLTSLQTGVSAPSAAAGDPVGMLGGGPRMKRASDAEAYVLHLGETERLLYDGLTAQSDPETAIQRFDAAARRAPSHYLPLLYGGHLEPDACRGLAKLTRALELNPASCTAAYLIGTRYEGGGDRERAARAFRYALQIAPDYAAAHEGLGRLCARAGKLDEACTHYEQALARNPFHSDARTRLAVLALERGDLRRARETLEENLPPGDSVDHFLLGRVHVEAGRYREALHHLERARAGCEEPTAVLALLAKAHLGHGDTRAASSLLAELHRLQREAADQQT